MKVRAAVTRREQDLRSLHCFPKAAIHVACGESRVRTQIDGCGKVHEWQLWTRQRLHTLFYV